MKKLILMLITATALMIGQLAVAGSAPGYVAEAGYHPVGVFDSAPMLYNDPGVLVASTDTITACTAGNVCPDSQNKPFSDGPVFARSRFTPDVGVTAAASG